MRFILSASYNNTKQFVKKLLFAQIRTLLENSFSYFTLQLHMLYICVLDATRFLYFGPRAAVLNWAYSLYDLLALF